MNIVLDNNEYSIDANRITLVRGKATSHYRLPCKAARVTVHEFEKGRGQLEIGGFKSLTVSVTGPLEVVRQLRDAVL